MDIDAIIRLQIERATDYCSACGGSGTIRVNITGSELDFITCHICKGTGQPQKFKDQRNKKIFKV